MSTRAGIRSLVVAAVLLLAPAARAYVLMGQHWPRNAFPIPWSLDADGAGGTLGTASRNEVIRAFDTWHAVSCANVTVGTPASLPAAQQREDGEGVNKIFWIASRWTYGSATLGVTTPRWYQGANEVFDADMVFNGQDWQWTTGTGNYCSDCTDVFSIALHEEGHFFGLGHTPVESAVMFASYDGSPKQTLATDDIRGICALYPKPTPGTGPQGAACSATADCVRGLTCTRPQSGTGTICTANCSGPSAATCPQGYTCQAAATGYACFLASDAVGDLCKACEAGSDCTSGQCIQAEDFAICSRGCGQGSGCPAGYTCAAAEGSGSFCYPTSQTCANNCSATQPCPASQECRSGSCRFKDLPEGAACPTGRCATGLMCVGDGTTYACRRTCNPQTAGSCPTDQACYGLQGSPANEGACFPASAREGDPCGTEACATGLVCVGATTADARCRRSCNPAAPSCPTGQVCTGLQGGGGACVQGSTPGTRTQGQTCTATSQCVTRLYCVDVGGGDKRCVTDCNPAAPACPGTPALKCNSYPGAAPAGSAGGFCWGTAPVTPKAGEGGSCEADSDCETGLICIRDTEATITCRTDCSAGRACPDGTTCRPLGSADVCLAPVTEEPGTGSGDGTPDRYGCPGCAGATAGLPALLALAVVGRRRRR